MLDHDSSAIVAVSDMDRARDFYSGVLGLELAFGGGEGSSTSEPLVYKTGATRLTVYPSQEAGTNRANAVCCGVGEDLDAIVADLAAKGVKFEHYPGIGRLDQGCEPYQGGLPEGVQPNCWSPRGEGRLR